jgi:outer membrane lipoprotein-sorting protein
MLTAIFLLSALVCMPVFSADLSLDNLIANLQGNQSKVRDMYAETTTTITSNIKLPNSKDSSPQKMVQKGKMWTKGQDKTKIEMLSPTKQVTITNGDQMAMINSETGQKVIQDLKKLRGKSGMSDASQQMSLDKAKEFFNLSSAKKGNDYVITGVPKKDNKFIGKMEFYVDSQRWVPVKIMMYDSQGKLVSESNIEYKQFSNIWLPIKNQSKVTTPMGKMDVEMLFENVRVNQGLSDREFKI